MNTPISINKRLDQILDEHGIAFWISETRSLKIISSSQTQESLFFIASHAGKVWARFGHHCFLELKNDLASDLFLFAGSDQRVLRLGSNGNTEYFSRKQPSTSSDPSLILTASPSNCSLYIFDPTISQSLCRLECPVKHLPVAMKLLLKCIQDEPIASKLLELYSVLCPELDFTGRLEVTDVGQKEKEKALLN